MDYYKKYLKYKAKYLALKNGGYWYANCSPACKNELYWGSHELAQILENKYNYCVKTNPSFDRDYNVNACQLYVTDIPYSQNGYRDQTHAHVYVDKNDWTLHVKVKYNGELYGDALITRCSPPQRGQTFQYDNSALNLYADKIHSIINQYFPTRGDKNQCFPEITYNRF